MRIIKLTFVITLLALSSCIKDELTVRPTRSFDRVVRLAEVNSITSELDELITDLDTVPGNSGLTRSRTCGRYTVQTNRAIKRIVFDFGQGCNRRKGKVLKGKIILIYQLRTGRNPFRDTDVSFEDFSINDVKVEGFEQRTLTNNRDNDPEWEIDADIDIRWPDGTTASYMGIKTVTKTRGAGTGSVRDDEYTIQGKLDVVLRDGRPYALEVLQPLKRKGRCKNIVSGKLRMKLGGDQGVLDYGDGDCDREAIFTNEDGSTEVVNLR